MIHKQKNPQISDMPGGYSADAVNPANPLICLGMPMYNQTRFLPEAVESILAQTYRDFKLIVVDDSTESGPENIIQNYASRDNRIAYFKNASRKGMVANWQSCLDQAGYPDYFAWVSDHDVWHADWLASLLRAMDTNSDAVLAYPRCVSIDLEGRRNPKKRSFKFSTAGLNEAQRIRAVGRDARGFGNMVYGLFRTEALRRAGIFRRVMFPDVVLLHELCLQGHFIQVDAELWYRRENAAFGIARQKRSLFVHKPLYLYLPWPLVNATALAWNTVVRPPVRDLKYRYGGLKIALIYLLRQIGRMGEGSWIGSYHEWRHLKKPWIKKLKKRIKNRHTARAA
jgi:glycosyltransferase involved in cell wall biosynthesis